MNYKMLMATAIIAAATVSAFGIPKVAHASGFSDGYAQARSDVQLGGQYNDKCSFQNTDAYCLDYGAGYRAGWTIAELAHRGANN
jgi:hypothetical protein